MLKLSNAGVSPTHKATARNHLGQEIDVRIAGERPLSIKVDDQELVTLMTLGSNPEDLALGYVRNQGIVDDITAIKSVKVDWDKETADIRTVTGSGLKGLEDRLSKPVVTSGCGQGTLFSCSLDKLYELKLSAYDLKQSILYALLKSLVGKNLIHKQAGSVHGCALCQGASVLMFIEDVGRHNAADAISGRMWIEDIPGGDKILYTTGRLTSEIVMKSAHMQIPIVVSRSGVTHMGLDLAQDFGITLIAKARGNRFLAFPGESNIIFDAIKTSQ
jgi:FdhD protein